MADIQYQLVQKVDDIKLDVNGDNDNSDNILSRSLDIPSESINEHASALIYKEVQTEWNI